MANLDSALDWAPSPGAAIDRATDLLDVDLADVAGDVLDAAGDLVEAAGEGIVAAAAATEAASRATFRLFRRHPLVVALLVGALVAGVVMMVGKHRKSADSGDTHSLHVAA